MYWANLVSMKPLHCHSKWNTTEENLSDYSNPDSFFISFFKQDKRYVIKNYTVIKKNATKTWKKKHSSIQNVPSKLQFFGNKGSGTLNPLPFPPPPVTVWQGGKQFGHLATVENKRTFYSIRKLFHVKGPCYRNCFSGELPFAMNGFIIHYVDFHRNKCHPRSERCFSILTYRIHVSSAPFPCFPNLTDSAGSSFPQTSVVLSCLKGV